MKPTFRSYQTRRDASREAAAYIARVLRETPGDVSLALSGGSSPTDTYRMLLDEDVPWERLYVLWVDERCVPPTHEDSNVRQARTVFLDESPVDPARILTPPDDRSDADAAAQQYEETLIRALGPDFAVTVAVMGMGSDGHTASLFPGHDFSGLPGSVAHTLSPPSSPVLHRLTLTLNALNRTRHAVYLVFGEDKADHVRRVAEGGACPDVPAACVAPREANVWFVDRAAAPAE
jgi:6-phosphogluconolactonase